VTRSGWALGVVAGTVLALGVTAGVVAVGTSRAADAAESEQRAETRAVAAAQDRAAALGEELAAQRATADERAAVLDARPAFTEALAAAGAALATADGRVDASAQRQRIVDAQTIVSGERADPAIVAASAEVVRTATAEVTTAVAAYEAEQARLAAEAAATAFRPGGSGRSSGGSGGSGGSGSGGGSGGSGSGGGSSGDSGGSGGGDWFSEARAILDRVGGGGIELRRFDGGCGAVEVAACAYLPAYIGVMPNFASLSYGRKVWLMTHELAHFYEGYVWWELQDSATFGSLFGGDMELLANCMAQARGAYNGCSGDRVAFAAGVWNGAGG
jgi:hypothetical protein